MGEKEQSPHTSLDKKYFTDFIGRIKLEKEKGYVSPEQSKKLTEIANNFPDLKVTIKEMDEVTKKESLGFNEDMYLGMLTQVRRELHEAAQGRTITKRQAKEFLKQLGLKEVKSGAEKKLQRGRGKKSR